MALMSSYSEKETPWPFCVFLNELTGVNFPKESREEDLRALEVVAVCGQVAPVCMVCVSPCVSVPGCRWPGSCVSYVHNLIEKTLTLNYFQVGGSLVMLWPAPSAALGALFHLGISACSLPGVLKCIWFVWTVAPYLKGMQRQRFIKRENGKGSICHLLN